MKKLELKPTHKAIKQYFEVLSKFNNFGVTHEGAVRSAFHSLLETCSKQFQWTLIPEYQKKRNGKLIFIDGALVDQYALPHGYWEAKDEADNLRKEIKKKLR